MSKPFLSQRWWFAALALTAVQGAFLHWGLQKPPLVRETPASSPQFFIAPELGGHNGRGWDPALSPTLFALPSIEGFSGEAWMRYARPMSAESLPEDIPQWTPMPVESLGASLSGFVAAVKPVPMRVADLPLPWIDSFPTAPPVASSSQMKLDGPASRRWIPVPIELPSWPAVDLLTATEVQVLVTTQGRVLSAVVADADSGLSLPGVTPGLRWPEAERFALDLSRQLVFKPITPSRPTSVVDADDMLQYCTVTFQWATVSPKTKSEASTKP